MRTAQKAFIFLISILLLSACGGAGKQGENLPSSNAGDLNKKAVASTCTEVKSFTWAKFKGLIDGEEREQIEKSCAQVEGTCLKAIEESLRERKITLAPVGLLDLAFEISTLQ